MLSTIHRQSIESKALADELGILHIVLNRGAHLTLTFGCEDSFRTSLRDIAGTIELAALTTVPKCIEAGSVSTFQFLGNNGVATTNTRESCRLGEAAELNRTLFRPFNLIDGMRQRVVLDESFIS